MPRLRSILRWLLALFFVGGGSNHFLQPELYLAMMPPWVAYPYTVNQLVGVAEIAAGLLVLPRVTRLYAGTFLLLLLLAVFPANIHMAVNDVDPPGLELPTWVKWGRLPFQAVFLAWVWWCCVTPAAWRRR